jgi:hypothetical protein
MNRCLDEVRCGPVQGEFAPGPSVVDEGLGRAASPRRGCRGSGTPDTPSAAQRLVLRGFFTAPAMVCLMLRASTMRTPRFIAALSASAMAHRHHLLLGVLLAAAACGGRSTDDLFGSAGGSAAGGAGQGGGAGAGTGGPKAGSGAGGQGGTNWTACGPTTTCVLRAVSCCGSGCEPVPLSAVTAINQASVADYENSHPVCPCAAPGCQSVPPEQFNLASYMATCEQGQCTAIDIRTSALTACTSSADCYLRAGTRCCSGCGDMVAFSRTADVQNAVCPSGPVACPAIDCIPIVPVGLSAVCNQSGHCVVSFAQAGAAGAAGP